MGPAVLSALAASITTSIFCDTAYHLYTRRLSDGTIGVPRVVYGSSAVMKTFGEYFVTRTPLSMPSC